jgi:hypothetical protein
MIVRPYRPSDRRALKAIHERAEYGFPFPKSLRNYMVVCDDSGEPLMAAGYKITPEVLILCAPGGNSHPLVKLKAMALLHESLRGKLVKKGFHEANAFLAPKAEKSYGRHLRRHFGWQESWTAYTIRDQKEGASG